MVTRKTKPAAKSLPATAARKAAAPSRATRPLRKAPRPAPVIVPPAVTTESKLSGGDLVKIIELGRGSDTIEIKLSIPSTGHIATIKSLRVDPVESQPRQAFFFDTPDLALFKAGVVVRARRSPGGRADTVVKLRPLNPATVDPELRRSASFKIEVDLMPGKFVCSGSYKGVCTGQEVLDVSAGRMPLSALFSKNQRAFYKAHAPAGISMDSLAVLGPTFLLKSRHQPKDYRDRVTVEMWLYPDGSRILEISTKCLPAEAFQVIAEFRDYLTRCGIAIGDSQETKTRTSLEFFSKQLLAAKGSRKS